MIASIFFFARDYKKPISEVLQACESEWQRNWNYQHPEIKGDPDAPGAAGLQNRLSLKNIYNALKIPLPSRRSLKPAPTEKITVKTSNSIYRFGEADNNGRCSISRDERPLDFSVCRITNLAVGQSMELECLDGTHPGWYTSTVLSIEKVNNIQKNS